MRTEHSSVILLDKYLFLLYFMYIRHAILHLPPEAPSEFPCAGHMFRLNIPPKFRVRSGPEVKSVEGRKTYGNRSRKAR
jgi:hypothetical protein